LIGWWDHPPSLFLKQKQSNCQVVCRGKQHLTSSSVVNYLKWLKAQPINLLTPKKKTHFDHFYYKTPKKTHLVDLNKPFHKPKLAEHWFKNQTQN